MCYQIQTELKAILKAACSTKLIFHVTSCPNSDVNSLFADKRVQTAFVWQRLLWKCWSRPKSSLFNLISSLALSGLGFLFPEAFLVTVGLSIIVGNGRAGYQNCHAVVCPRWPWEAGFCFDWLQGEGTPEFKMHEKRKLLMFHLCEFVCLH